MKKVFNSKYSIKNKLIFSFVSITIISLLLMGMVTHALVINQSKKDYTDSVQKEIIHVNNGIEDYLELILENTQMLSQNSLIQQADSRITSYVDKEDPSGKIEMTPLENDPYEAEVYNILKNFKDSHPEMHLLKSEFNQMVAMFNTLFQLEKMGMMQEQEIGIN